MFKLNIADELNEKLAIGCLLFGDIHTACSFAVRVLDNRFEATAMLRGGYPSDKLLQEALTSLMNEVKYGDDNLNPA